MSYRSNGLESSTVFNHQRLRPERTPKNVLFHGSFAVNTTAFMCCLLAVFWEGLACHSSIISETTSIVH